MSRSVHSETTHRGRLLTVEVRRFHDDEGRAVEREVVRHPGAVVILPVLADGRIVMIRNHRHSIDRRLWELPAGTLEPGEPPALAAARELEEETGYRAGSIDLLGTFFTSPGFLDEELHIYLAEGLALGDRSLDPGEDIDVVPQTEAEVFALIDDGALCDGKTLAAMLLWLRRSRRVGP